MNQTQSTARFPEPSTVDGFENAVIDFDSTFVRSVRSDYSDVSEDTYVSYYSDGHLVQPEIHQVQTHESSHRVYGRMSVYCIELVNYPVARYTLNVNGHNVGSSNSQNKFNIFQIHNNMMRAILKVGEDCMKNMSIYHQPPKTCLHLRAYDCVKVCVPKGILVPDTAIIRLHYYDTVFHQQEVPDWHERSMDTHVCSTTLLMSYPTSYLVLTTKPDSHYELQINGLPVVNVSLPKHASTERLIVKFTEPPAEYRGRLDKLVRQRATLNMSRIDMVSIKTDNKDCKVYQCRYSVLDTPKATGDNVMKPTAI